MQTIIKKRNRRLNVSKYTNEIEKRRTFAIISHPDAGKTTLTEKFLLYGGAINLALIFWIHRDIRISRRILTVH